MIILLPSKITVIKWCSLTFVVYCRHWRMHQQLSQVWSKRCLSEYRGLIHLHLQSWILWILLILFYSIPKYNNYNNGHSRSSFWQLIRHIEYLLIAHLVSYRLLLCSVLTTCPSVGLNLSYIAIRQNKVIKNYQRYYSDYHLFSPSLDIDECSNKTHTCDVNAVCSNTQGSHNCTCKPGYSGDGKKCIAIGMQHPYRIPLILSTIISCCLVRKSGSVYEYFA